MVFEGNAMESWAPGVQTGALTYRKKRVISFKTADFHEINVKFLNKTTNITKHAIYCMCETDIFEPYTLI